MGTATPINQVLGHCCLILVLMSAVACASPSYQSDRALSLSSEADPRDMPVSLDASMAAHLSIDTYINWLKQAVCSPRVFQEVDAFYPFCKAYCNKQLLETFEGEIKSRFARCEPIFAFQLSRSIEALNVRDKAKIELLKNSIYETQQSSPEGMANYAIAPSSMVDGTLAFMEKQEPFVNGKSSLSEHEFEAKFDKSVRKPCASVNGKLEPVVEVYRMHLGSILVAHVNRDLLSWVRASKLCQIVTQTIELNLFYEAYKTMRKSKKCSLVGSVLSCGRSN